LLASFHSLIFLMPYFFFLYVDQFFFHLHNKYSFFTKMFLEQAQ